jgi:hypothetical protein
MSGCASAGFLVDAIPRVARICSPADADATAVVNVVGSIPLMGLAAWLIVEGGRRFYA